MSGEKLWTGRFVQLLFIEITLQFGAYMTNPVVSGYALVLGASVAGAGFLAGLTATTALVMRPFSGALSDRVGKKQLLMTAAALFSVASFGCALAPTPMVLGVCRVIQGVGFALRSVSVIALVSLTVPHSCLGRAVGWTGLGQTVSCALGPFVGEWVIGVAGYPASFGTAGLLFALGLALVCSVRAPQGANGRFSRNARERHTAHIASGVANLGSASEGEFTSTSRDVFKSSGLSARVRCVLSAALNGFIRTSAIPSAVMSGLATVPHGVVLALLLVAAPMRGVQDASLYFVLYSVAALAAKPLAGRISDGYGLGTVIVPSLLVEVAAMAVFSCMSSLAFVAVAAVLMGVGHASSYAALQSESVRDVGPGELGRAANTFYLGTDIGMGFGPLVAGAVLGSFGPSAMFGFAGVMPALALATFLVLRAQGRMGDSGRRRH